jgi:hypothetical protein
MLKYFLTTNERIKIFNISKSERTNFETAFFYGDMEGDAQYVRRCTI